MTGKDLYFAILAIAPLLTMSLTTNSEIHYTNALVQRDFSYLHDNHCTVLYNCASAQICGDHVCSPGEYTKHIRDMEVAQLSHAAHNVAQPAQIIPQLTTHPSIPTGATATPPAVSSLFRLSDANLPLVIPLIKGLYGGKNVYYITTDSSDSGMASLQTNYTGFQVNFAPTIAKAPASALSDVYTFKNGIKGSSVLGFQPDVFDSIPTEPKYSPLMKVNYVEWKDPSKATLLGSDDDIIAAEANGLVTVTPTNIVCNSPVVQWSDDKEGTVPAGHMQMRRDTTLADDTPYGGGQVLHIDTQKMQVTFVAHRGFGPDGSTIYYIVTDTVMVDPAMMMGVTLANKTQATFVSGASSDLFQFMNGIKGTGPMGYQAGIGSTKPGDQFYSPIWRISMISWNDPSSATILENTHDISSHSNQIKVTSMNMVVNCPFFSADTVFEHTK